MNDELLLGLIGIALAVGFGVGDWFRGRRSDVKTSDRFDQLEQRLVLLDPNVGPKAGRLDYVAVDYADVNNDGRLEMIVQHTAGVHGMGLRVMGFDDLRQFEDIGYLGSGTPEGFTVGDIDGDGQVEIATVEADWDRKPPDDRSSYSYADGARMEVLYRWEDGEFREVGRRELPMPGEGPRERKWSTNPLPQEPAKDNG